MRLHVPYLPPAEAMTSFGGASLFHGTDDSWKWAWLLWWGSSGPTFPVSSPGRQPNHTATHFFVLFAGELERAVCLPGPPMFLKDLFTVTSSRSIEEITRKGCQGHYDDVFISLCGHLC